MHGAKLIRNGMKILTHCNAGWLAFVDIGTATAPMYAAQAQGKNFHVFCDETRPRSQGATLTAWELAQAWPDSTLVAVHGAEGADFHAGPSAIHPVIGSCSGKAAASPAQAFRPCQFTETLSP